MARPPQTIASLALIAAGFALAPSEAEAGGDAMWGTRGGDSMVEIDHQIALTFERGYATMVVRRTVHNHHDRHDEAVYELELPDGGVAIGLRTLGVRRGKPHWYRGELLEAELAGERYAELTGMDPHQPEVRDPALLAWGWDGGLTLQVFPIDPGADKTIEYSVDLPAQWEDGRWRIHLADTGLDELPAELIVTPSNAADRLYLDDQAIGAGHRLTLDDSHVLELVPDAPEPIELELASIDTGSDRAVSYVRVAVAPELSTLPKRARVVVALDLSRSLAPEQVEAQRRAALAYIEHWRDPALASEVAVYGFDHAIRPLTPGFVTADRASGALRGAPLERDNGSAVELAFAEAVQLFGSSSAKTPRRVLLLTDFETASARTQADYEALASATKAVVHLAEVRSADASLARDDGHPWASVAARTEGVVWQASAGLALDADGIATFEEWARPIRIDALALDVDGRARFDSGLPSSLEEGQGFDDLELTDEVAERLTLTGLLWNRSIQPQVRQSRSLSKRWAGLVFGSWLYWELEREEMLALALLGGAVSPVTSYLAIEPGVRPSAEGLERGQNTGLIGKDGCGGTGAGYGSVRGAPFGGRLDRQAWLDEQLHAAWRACGGAGQAGTIELESTFEEVVDFTLPGSGDLALTTCMEARLWALWLPATDFIDSRRTWTVTL